MHTQTILVFLEIKLPRNSNKILKTDLFKEMGFEKVFENGFFILKKVLKINCTNWVTLGVPICLPVILVNGASSDYYK